MQSVIECKTPWGPFALTMDDENRLVSCRPGAGRCIESGAIAILSDYLAGRRRDLAWPLQPRGTAFQARVWDALRAIPYGEVTTYGALAARLGSSPRAVGAAVGANPLAIFIPCHRVVGSDGSLTGYAWGLAMKRDLLSLEGACLPNAAAVSLRSAR